MATAAPNSYKDPYWSNLASGVEQKLDLPQGLLVGVLTKGEKSNADQVSEAGAKTPFQVIPSTRNLVMNKYGVDAYLSPENAAEAAGLLLKESLQRNRNDPALAVAEYHGGTNRANWGPRTKAYVQRVTGDGIAAPVSQQTARQSTFQRALEAQQQATPAAASISNIFNAYKAGQMAPEDAAQFEQDVRDGKMMLPRGAALATAAPAVTGAVELPPGVLDAYAKGVMTPEERSMLENDLRAGTVKLPAGASLGQVAAVSQIPGQEGGAAPTQGLPPQEPSFGEQLIGAGEAALALGTGASGGTLGTIGNTVRGLVGQMVAGEYGTPEAARALEQSAAQGGQALTYAPRTQAGQNITAAAGDILNNVLPPVMPAVANPGALAAGFAAARPAAQAVREAAVASARQAAPAVSRAAQVVTAPARAATNAVREITGMQQRAPDAQAAPGGPARGASIGAALVNQDDLRQAAAKELPIPIDLTKGQRSRGFEDQRFERETAKLGEVGEPLRERFALQNQQLARNLDAFIDATGSQASEMDFRRATGLAVNEALRSRAARDKAQIRTLYKEAEKSGEMSSPVDLAPMVEYLNQNRAGRSSAPIMKTVADEIGVQGVGAGSLADGTLNIQPVTLSQAENLRKAINRFAKLDDANDMRIASELKNLIDMQTQGAGGEKYQQARAARSRYAQNYENIGIIKNLLGTKRGSSDRIVALEDVLNRTVLDSGASLDSVKQVRRLLQTEGDVGKQAWREIQGGTLQYIKEQALKNVAPDVAGNRVMSPAQLDRIITSLDRTGKLDFIFGKKGAEQLRTLNDVAKDVLTSPSGAVNNSNTASTLAAMVDVVASGLSGIPAPLATSFRYITSQIKDKKLRARVNEHLNP